MLSSMHGFFKGIGVKRKSTISFKPTPVKGLEPRGIENPMEKEKMDTGITSCIEIHELGKHPVEAAASPPWHGLGLKAESTPTVILMGYDLSPTSWRASASVCCSTAWPMHPNAYAHPDTTNSLNTRLILDASASPCYPGDLTFRFLCGLAHTNNYPIPLVHVYLDNETGKNMNSSTTNLRDLLPTEDAFLRTFHTSASLCMGYSPPDMHAWAPSAAWHLASCSKCSCCNPRTLEPKHPQPTSLCWDNGKKMEATVVC